MGSGAQPPQLSPSESEAPTSVQSALREVRPDDLDAIFDGALFGPPALKTAAGEGVTGAQAAAPVPVGAMDWYMERDSQPAGPFRLERLRELWHQGGFEPDTLFWCEAWPSWRPLSRVPELVAAMTISGLPTVAADASLAVSSARAKESGSEKKVVSALHSLVAEEEGWLRKQQEEKEQVREERSALLEAPSAPAPVAPPMVAPPVPMAVVPAPVPPQMDVPAVPYPQLPMAPPVAHPMLAPAPLQASEPPRRGRTFLAGALIGSAAVGVLAGALFLLPQALRSPEQARPVLASEEAAPRLVPVEPQAAAPAPVAAVAPVVQPPPAPVVQPAARPPQPEAVASKAIPASPQPEKPKPVVVAAVAPMEQKEAASRHVSAPASEERIARAAESTLQRRQQPPPAPVAPASTEVRKAPPEEKRADDPTNFDDSLDKEFEKELGFSKGQPQFKAEDPRSKRSVYIPPEPGKDLPEHLSTSAILQVVSAHKDAILSCIETHEPPKTSDSGKDRFVVRWRVLPTGTATEVLLETESLKGTAFARCIEGQVRSWKFPEHRTQSREPVRFPFTY
ncbi:hypothetical protein DAT35_04585 [Vitiosangium sp. GDMCC 1.1324]|nr:hypothetical protein DAT35_04585 [Vitiosangium sp. GDMCC 1.1324]